MWNFRLFQQARCEVIVKYTNCNLLENESIRTGIRTLEAQIDEKSNNIEAGQNVTGSYKKKSVSKTSEKLHFSGMECRKQITKYSSVELEF